MRAPVSQVEKYGNRQNSRYISRIRRSVGSKRSHFRIMRRPIIIRVGTTGRVTDAVRRIRRASWNIADHMSHGIRCKSPRNGVPSRNSTRRQSSGSRKSRRSSYFIPNGRFRLVETIPDRGIGHPESPS